MTDIYSGWTGTRSVKSKAHKWVFEAIYGYLRLYSNHFQPVMKLVEKVRIGSKVRKKYDNPKTPCQKLIDCPFLPKERN